MKGIRSSRRAAVPETHIQEASKLRAPERAKKGESHKAFFPAKEGMPARVTVSIEGQYGLRRDKKVKGFAYSPLKTVQFEICVVSSF